MKTMILRAFQVRNVEMVKVVLLFVILVLLYPLAQRFILNVDATSGYVDLSVVLLVLLSVIYFMGLLGLCWWLFNRFLLVFELPGVGSMVSGFKNLGLCQQFGFYFGSFGLLLLAAIGCLAAVL